MKLRQFSQRRPDSIVEPPASSNVGDRANGFRLN